MSYVNINVFKVSSHNEILYDIEYDSSNLESGLALCLRRGRLALQFTIKIAAYPNNYVYETMFNPRYVDHFNRNPRVIPTFVISIMEKLDFNPDIVEKFQIP